MSAAAEGRPLTAVRARLVGCHSCGLLISDSVLRDRRPPRCPRCATILRRRKADSQARSAAFLIAALAFYVPANIFPIMTVTMLGRGQPDTILSGVLHLIAAGEYPVAAVVFFASIFVPVIKIAVLAFLLISVRLGSKWRPRDRTAIYRITESIGRWSMIDIFMISILVGLVKLGAVATVEAGLAATSFAAVVILTMIAALCFDPRLIWDRAEAPDE